MGMIFALILLFASGDAVTLDGPLSAADCAPAMMWAPTPPTGSRLLCVQIGPRKVVS